jgi:hypothetical protein
MAIAHFAYGVPIQNNDTGKPATLAEVVAGMCVIGGGGLFFVIMGVLLHRWQPNVRSDS